MCDQDRHTNYVLIKTLLVIISPLMGITCCELSWVYMPVLFWVTLVMFFNYEEGSGK